MCCKSDSKTWKSMKMWVDVIETCLQSFQIVWLDTSQRANNFTNGKQNKISDRRHWQNYQIDIRLEPLEPTDWSRAVGEFEEEPKEYKSPIFTVSGQPWMNANINSLQNHLNNKNSSVIHC